MHEYAQFELIHCVLLLFLSEEADDEDDPEYNFLADLREPDQEDYSTDRAVRITSKLQYYYSLNTTRSTSVILRYNTTTPSIRFMLPKPQ